MSATEHLRLTIPGPPRGQARTGGNGRQRFTPPADREATARIQAEWIAAGRPTLPADAPYALHVVAYHARPASHWRKDGSLNAEGARRPFPGKPDIDNVVKLVADALVACGALPDDRLMFQLSAEKCWAVDGVAEVRVRAVTR